MLVSITDIILYSLDVFIQTFNYSLSPFLYELTRCFNDVKKSR